MDVAREKDEAPDADPTARRAPRFGSYMGVFYVLAIVGILTWTVLRDAGTGPAFDRLRPGMSPTQVAALLGVPRSETVEDSRTVQTWRNPDGGTFVIEFQDRKLVRKLETHKPSAGPERPHL